MIGIDSINFSTSCYYLKHQTLAKSLDVDVEKFFIGLGQYQMGIVPPDEDIITLGANAASRLLEHTDIQNIDHLLFATESGIDQSKAAGIYVHNLLALSPRCSVVEIKQACYSSTAALQMAVALVRSKPSRKVLVIASDISRYGFNKPGESSQGCGAVAMLITKNPRVLAILPERGLYTKDIMDFWRPTYSYEPLVEGKYSEAMYYHALEQVWRHYKDETNLKFDDQDFYCYHTPTPRIVEKAHLQLAKINGYTLSEEECKQQLASALCYNRLLGNCYSASLYISLISLLEQAEGDLSGARVGFYSYGSGCVAEFFIGIIQPSYKKMCGTFSHKNLLDSRLSISYEKYQSWYSFRLPEDGTKFVTPCSAVAANRFRLTGIENHKRNYARI